MPPQTALTRYDGWLPKNHNIHHAFFNEHLELAKLRKGANVAHEPAVLAFEQAIKSNHIMYTLFGKIFLQASPENHIPDFEHLLYIMDLIIVAAPKFHIVAGKGEPIGFMFLFFDLLSNTDAAYVLFRMPEFNVAMKNLLNAWGNYLKTEDSSNTLTDAEDGWFGAYGIRFLEEHCGVFNETYVIPDPDATNRGYTSWDDFFTREVQSAARPIDVADDMSLIHNACESTIYRIAYNVKKHDQFWLKAQRYSIYDMLDTEADVYADKFAGGTVYQAYLGPQDYHRWRSPINGTIEKAINIPGTYCAILPDAGAESDDPIFPEGDPRGAILRSQAWLTISSARALVFIQADNPVIGLMCFIAVGMVDISTCALSVTNGQKVKTGDELGMFHFGGSSHTLIFGPQVKVTFSPNVVINQHLWVNSVIAQVSPATQPAQPAHVA